MTTGAILRKKSNFVFRKIGDESVLVPIVNNAGDLSSIFTLNETGTRLWELLDNTGDIRELYTLFLSEYDVPPDTAANDISEFIENLLNVNFLEKA